MVDRFLVMGDNHGDTESLRRVLGDSKNEQFDFAVHVGDFTKAWRTSRQQDDEQRGKKLGVDQLQAVEPILEKIDSRTEHGLLWVWGNQDYFGDLDYDLDVGTEIPDDGCVEVGGRQFTNSLDHVKSNVVLVTHMEYWRLLDHFDGLAHFCGNSHRGRQLDRRLNAAFLKLTDPDTDTTKYGGYFIVEVTDDGIDVEPRAIGDLERKPCDRHCERGMQYRPADKECIYCEDQRILWRDMCSTAFYGLTAESEADSVDENELVEYAAGLWDDPPRGFRDDFRAYLSEIGDDRYAPLTRVASGRLAVAERSYMY